MEVPVDFATWFILSSPVLGWIDFLTSCWCNCSFSPPLLSSVSSWPWLPVFAIQSRKGGERILRSILSYNGDDNSGKMENPREAVAHKEPRLPLQPLFNAIPLYTAHLKRRSFLSQKAPWQPCEVCILLRTIDEHPDLEQKMLSHPPAPAGLWPF